MLKKTSKDIRLTLFIYLHSIDLDLKLSKNVLKRNLNKTINKNRKKLRVMKKKKDAQIRPAQGFDLIYLKCRSRLKMPK